MTSLADALRISGVVEEMKQQKKRERETPKEGETRTQHKWWQNFRLSLTRFEIPTLLVVRCERWEDGLKFIRDHHLNHVTTRCKDETEARDQVRRSVVEWYQADDKTKEPELGSLLYWRIY